MRGGQRWPVVRCRSLAQAWRRPVRWPMAAEAKRPAAALGEGVLRGRQQTGSEGGEGQGRAQQGRGGAEQRSARREEHVVSGRASPGRATAVRSERPMRPRKEEGER